MSFKKFIEELNGSRVEGELLKTIFYSLLTSLIVLAAFYYLKLSSIENFSSKYGFYLFFALIGYAAIVPAVRQIRAYRQFGCMPGMMIGMTVGMISGFLSGYLIGATNGMFVGGVFGMAVGILLGIWMGSSCGIMGFMEGIMAGFMGGLMGAMTSVMLLNEHIKIMTAIIFAICAIILFSLNYMIYQETKENEREIKEDHFITIILSAILMAATILLMVFGQKGGVLG